MHIVSEYLETPSVPRLSENAMWLLGQRYFVQRWDASVGGLRKEGSFEDRLGVSLGLRPTLPQ